MEEQSVKGDCGAQGWSPLTGGAPVDQLSFLGGKPDLKFLHSLYQSVEKALEAANVGSIQGGGHC